MMRLATGKPTCPAWTAVALCVALLCSLGSLGFSRSAVAPPASRAAVDPRIAEYEPVEGLSGHLNAVGADTMETLMKYWIQGFEHDYPAVTVSFESKVSGAAAPALIAGSAQIGPVAREMLPAELAAFKNKFGYEPLAIAVAGGSYMTKGKTHAIAFFVNKKNPINNMTFGQLDAIYSRTRKRGLAPITRWGQLGLKGKWTDAPIHLYGVKRPNGIAHFILLRVLEGGEYRDGIRSYTTVGSLNALDAITQAVGRDPDGIGYAGLQDANPNVKALALAKSNGGPYVRETFENVLTHRYPLSREIYIYLNKPPHKPLDPDVREFLRFILSRQGQQAVVKEGIFLPLPYHIDAWERAKLGQ